MEMTTVIGSGVSIVAWGKSWATFFLICKELENESDSALKMKHPDKFSQTKFADHAHKVYDKFRNNIKPFIVTMEQAKEEGRVGSTDAKKKAEKAEEVQGKVFNWMFCLSLSMVTDVYKVYHHSIALSSRNLIFFHRISKTLSYLRLTSSTK